MLTKTRSLVALAAFAVVSAAVPALAGPPLICHPFETRGGALLPWDARGAATNWNAPLASYATAGLTDDVMKLLDADSPVLTRMENLRRATIYAQKDPAVARQLLDAVMVRAKSSRTIGAQASFDAGYLIESYKQATHIPREEGGYGLGRRRRDAEDRRLWSGEEGDGRDRHDESRDGIRRVADDAGSPVTRASRAGVGERRQRLRAGRQPRAVLRRGQSRMEAMAFAADRRDPSMNPW